MWAEQTGRGSDDFLAVDWQGNAESDKRLIVETKLETLAIDAVVAKCTRVPTQVQ